MKSFFEDKKEGARLWWAALPQKRKRIIIAAALAFPALIVLAAVL